MSELEYCTYYVREYQPGYYMVTVCWMDTTFQGEQQIQQIFRAWREAVEWGEKMREHIVQTCEQRGGPGDE